MMADPGMFSAEDQRLAGVVETDPHAGGIPESESGAAVPSQDPATSAAESAEPGEPAGRGLPLLASVLLADLALALVALIAFVIIGVQRLDDATMDQRRAAYHEDLVVFLAVGAIFALVAYLLHRAGQAKVALVQAVVAVVALGLGGYAMVNGNPARSAVISPIVPEESPSPTAP
jgi:hypothetical protein